MSFTMYIRKSPNKRMQFNLRAFLDQDIEVMESEQHNFQRGVLMKSIEESIAQAMDCENTSIVSFLPYILQDFWEIGSSAESILSIVKENTKNCFDLNILDLGCGKEAVSIKLAIELKCTCLGIDAIQDFIDIANHKAKQNDIADQC